MTTYTDATVARCATIIARTDAAQLARILAGTQQAPAAPKAPRKPKAVRKTAEQIKQDKRWAQMSGRLATFGQMERINALYEERNLRTFATLASFQRVFDMADASREWNKLTGRYAG